MLYCYGEGCPLRTECYRHTQPSPGRDAFGSLPYNPETQSCDQLYSNMPTQALINETAYYVWQRAGCPENRALEHWYQAYLSLCVSSGRIPSL